MTQVLDKDAYRREVLDPARARGNALPADLLARYALRPEEELQGDRLTEHLAEVVAYWRTVRQRQKSYAKLIDGLLVAHAKLTEQNALTWDALKAETDRQVKAATTRLAEAAVTLAGSGSRISRAALGHLVADTGGTLSEAEVRQILVEHGISIVERTWVLPDAPPWPAHRTMRNALNLLGLRLSAEVVVGTEEVRRGFRLRDGFRLAGGAPAGVALTKEKIAAVLRDSAARVRDERKAATESVLSTLKEAAGEPERLDAMLLWEVMEILRPQVAAGLPAKMISEQAAALGLVREEAEELALAMLAHEPRSAGPAYQIQEALEEGRLRAAERLLPGLAPDDPLRGRIEERGRQVAAWTGQATEELAAGCTEAAAELLDKAWRSAADDEAIGDRLRALPPPPAGDVRAGAQSSRVTVAWAPSAAHVGPVHYRVVRTIGAPASGAADGITVGETETNELVDRAPPPAEELYYTVFAGRAAGIWSAPVSAPRLTVLPEIIAPAVTAGEREVTATWRLPPGASEAIVSRLDPHVGQPTSRGGSGFADVGVTPGETYRYRVQVAYERSDGTRRLSRGVVLTGLPESAPRAVLDLTVELDGEPPAARIGWPPPAGGRVVIRAADGPPPWPRGTTLTQAEVERYGSEVPAVPAEGANGWMTIRAPLAGAYFTAVSVGAGRAVIGASARLVIVEPVRELTALRLGDTMALSWQWPVGAQLVEVTWAPAGASVEEPGAGTVTVECRRRAYEDNGCRIEIGPGAVVASVRTVAGEIRSRPVTASVPGIGPEVRYEFRRPRLSRRREAVLILTAERHCQVPPLVVVRRAGTVLPLRPEQGEVIHEVPAQELSPDSPLTLRIAVPHAAKPSRLACFVASGTADVVTLIPLPGTW
ncbi:hypothetical protein [Nonomuraea monospora]|uniref:hypothetical protein n=1 Tax=Nonomuraea monospora TaxID=568818 RepID=UPI0031D55982